MIRVAINGYGRIGRLAHRIILEKYKDKIEIAAINTGSSTDILGWMYLLKYDTVYGPLEKHEIKQSDKNLFKDSIGSLFVDAKEDVLLRRYSQTRRHHPLEPSGEVLKGIRLEREKMMELRESADKLLDTSDMNVHQLRQNVFDLYAPRKRLDRMAIHILSFGFKYGLPADANLVLDVRFLPNPYFEEGIRGLSGIDREVRDFVLASRDTMEFLSHSEGLLRFLLPRYRNEGKSYLVIAVGCTGGRHRSVVIAEYLRDKFMKDGEEVIINHRDVNREG